MIKMDKNCFGFILQELLLVNYLINFLMIYR